MISNRRVVFIILVLLITFSCGRSTDKGKKIFRYNESSGITTLDPLKATNLANIWAVQQVYEGLTRIDSAGHLQPLLADSWKSNSGLDEYTFYLKPNVFFHSSPCFKHPKKFSAYDVQYSMQRVLGSSSAWILKNVQIDTITNEPMILVKDSFTLVIQLSSPSITFPQMMAMPPCAIVPKEAVDYYGAQFRSNPVGTGPFIFHRWHENEKLIFHKNSNYHLKGFPLIDGIAISFLKDKQTALLEFIRGNFDLISGLDAAYKDELLDANGRLNPSYEDKIRMTKNPYLNTEYLGILLDSTIQTPLQNVHIRRALNYGLDRKRLITYIRNGIGMPGHAGMIPTSMYSEIQAVAGYGFDKNRFNEEIGLAGYGSADQVPAITLHTDVAYTDICTYIVNQWNELGLKVKLEVLDRPTLKSEVAKGNLAFFRASWIADYPDPENYMSLLYGPMRSPAGPNYTHFDQREYNRLFEAASKDSSYHERLKKYLNMEELMLKEPPVIILYYDEVIRFTNTRVKNLPPHPMNYLDLRKVELN